MIVSIYVPELGILKVKFLYCNYRRVKLRIRICMIVFIDFNLYIVSKV